MHVELCGGAQGAEGCLPLELLTHGGAERGKASKRRETLAAGSSKSAREVSGVTKGTKEEREASTAIPHWDTTPTPWAP